MLCAHCPDSCVHIIQTVVCTLSRQLCVHYPGSCVHIVQTVVCTLSRQLCAHCPDSCVHIIQTVVCTLSRQLCVHYPGSCVHIIQTVVCTLSRQLCVLGRGGRFPLHTAVESLIHSFFAHEFSCGLKDQTISAWPGRLPVLKCLHLLLFGLQYLLSWAHTLHQHVYV